MLLLEGVLQVAALVVQARTGAVLPTSWETGHTRILCLGDSNTYGVVVPRDRTYPQQLETLWNRWVGTPPVEVMNLGFPGTNSSRVVRDLPKLLESFEPQIVIVMVGVNDFWTLPFSVEPEAARVGAPERSFWRHSRLYRLYYLFRRGSEAPEARPRLEIEMDPDASFEGGARHRLRYGDLELEMEYAQATPELRGDVDGLRRNLRTITDQVEAAGARLYLMTYPARKSFYGVANPVIREVAAASGTPLIDLASVFEPLCPEASCPEYLLRDEHHPNARGYRVVAETIVDQLRAAER